MEVRTARLGGLNLSTSALGWNLWSITHIRFVVFRVLGGKTSLFLFFSCPPYSSNPSSSSNPNSSTTTPPPPQSSLKEDPDVTGSPTRSTPLAGWTGNLPRARGHWRVCCCVEGACEEVDWGWDVELVGQEEQEVVLINLELAAWMVNFGPLGDTFPGL